MWFAQCCFATVLTSYKLVINVLLVQFSSEDKSWKQTSVKHAIRSLSIVSCTESAIFPRWIEILAMFTIIEVFEYRLGDREYRGNLKFLSQFILPLLGGGQRTCIRLQNLVVSGY